MAKGETLEERLKGLKIILGEPSEGRYEFSEIAVVDESIEAAENRLLTRVIEFRTEYFLLKESGWKKAFGSKNYVVSGVAYRPVPPKAA